MFTGLVEQVGEIAEVKQTDGGGARQLLVRSTYKDAKLGESVAVNGCCLTVVTNESGVLSFDVSPETLSLTNLGGLEVGGQVNLERATPLGERLGGHLVSGHVDGQAEIISAENVGAYLKLIVRIDRELSRFAIQKGSATLNGVSLTINNVEDTEKYSDLEFMLIPETQQRTNLDDLPAGRKLNFEADMLAKFVDRLNTRK